MAEIFVSHSRRDEAVRAFFSNVFAGSNVAGKFVEFEEFESPPWQYIQERVNAARAVFVLLGSHVSQLSYTRDWVNWETGVASQAGKEIWVFERLGDDCNVAVPHVSHYVAYEPNEDALQYVKLIVNSYDDSGQTASLVKGAAAGGAIGYALAGDKDKKDMAALGAFLGALIGANRTDPRRVRPVGMPVNCVCKSAYHVHARLHIFRCPTCRQWISVSWPLASGTTLA